MDIEEIPGIKPKVVDKLLNAGFDTVESLAVASPQEVAVMCNISEGQAVRLIKKAAKMVDVHFTVARELTSHSKIPSGCGCIDELLGGGVELGGITEIFGDHGVGKSWLCAQLVAGSQLWGKCSAIVIDTHGRFRMDSVKKATEGLGLDADRVLGNVLYKRVFDSNEQILVVRELRDTVSKLSKDGKPVKLVVVDALTYLFTIDYDTSLNPMRQKRLYENLRDLLELATRHDVAVVVTNYPMKSNPRKSYGGKVLSLVTTKLYARVNKKNQKRVLEIVSSPNLPHGKVSFAITDRGLSCA